MATKAARLAAHECRCEIPAQINTTEQREAGSPEVLIEGLGVGDSAFVPHLMPIAQADGMFERIRDEVPWCVMRHKGGQVPRLVSMQASIDSDGEACGSCAS
jgi:hypothetical protein